MEFFLGIVRSINLMYCEKEAVRRRLPDPTSFDESPTGYSPVGSHQRPDSLRQSLAVILKRRGMPGRKNDQTVVFITIRLTGGVQSHTTQAQIAFCQAVQGLSATRVRSDRVATRN